MMKRMMRVLALAMVLVMLLGCSGLAETLKFPDRGAGVVRLQEALKQAGYYTGTIDGQFGTGTRAAVVTFQTAQGLTADGIAGAATQKRLQELTGIVISPAEEEDEPAPTDPGSLDGLFKGNYATIQFGAEGDRVRILQRALMALGCNIPAIDGDFGTSTYQAVKAFQKAVKLEADGKAGPQTLKKIESYFDKAGNILTGPIVTDSPDPDENIQYGEPTRTLRKGMSGLDVQYTQERLKTLKYYAGTMDGQFGSGMYQAVVAFQERNGLSADGVIGAGTRKLLFAEGAIAADEVVPTPETHRTLRLGMEGADVAALQVRLRELGYYTMAVDSQYGKGTVAAVKAFQGRNGLKVDGVCGEDTSNAIYSDKAIEAGSTVTNPPDVSVSAPPTRTLQKGDKGNDVMSVQLRLKALGYYTIAVDGQYGSGTVTAVKFFQVRNGLTVDGKVGEKTVAVLYSDAAIAAGSGSTETLPPTDEPAVTPSKTLRFGDKGTDVMLLQSRLIELGYLKGTADGAFGTATLNALKAFQLANGLTADGVAGAKTYKKLYSDTAVKPEDEPTDGIPTRELSNGCKGEDVKLVQTRLKALGYLTGSADGEYGSATAAAMLAFQQRNALNATGVGNEETYKVLFSDSAIAADGGSVDLPGETYKTLRMNATGNEVIRLQQMLLSLKYTVNVTGTYDETTYAAVMAFQRRNGLDVDGVAGQKTQTKLYSGNCVTGDTVIDGGDGGSGGSGNGGGPASIGKVQLLHWENDIKKTLIKNGSELLVYEPVSNSSYYVRVYAQGLHCDAEPVTKNDVATMIAAWGGTGSWNEKPVYVRLPNGTWCIASTHSMAHEENFIANNNFDGHICIHFPRDMEDVVLDAPKNGVRHQNDIRKHWKAITGEDIPW